MFHQPRGCPAPIYDLEPVYVHLEKPGIVVVPGHPGADLAPGTLSSILKQAGLKLRYAVVIEKTETGYSAYVSDLPGCVSVGETREQMDRNIREAIELYLYELREGSDTRSLRDS